MKRKKKKVDQKVLGYDINDPEQKKALIDHISKEYKSGKAMKEVLEVPQGLLDNVHALAYQKYENGDYERAADFFRYLLLFDEHCYSYLLGLAASLHKKGDFAEAAQTYLLAAIHDPTDPVPNFHGADCYLKLGKEDMAQVALHTAIHIAGSREEYAELKARAEMIVDNLAKKSEK